MADRNLPILGPDGEAVNLFTMRGILHLHDCGHVYWQRMNKPPTEQAEIKVEFDLRVHADFCAQCEQQRQALLQPDGNGKQGIYTGPTGVKTSFKATEGTLTNEPPEEPDAS